MPADALLRESLLRRPHAHHWNRLQDKDDAGARQASEDAAVGHCRLGALPDDHGELLQGSRRCDPSVRLNASADIFKHSQLAEAD